MSKIGWTHPIDESDQWDGFNDPGIEHFSGSPTRNLAREVNQNSLDAYDDASNKPVLIRISKHSVPVSSIPNVDQLRKTIALCQASVDEEGLKAKQFFETAAAELSKPKITVLEISDYNTKGMSGPSRNGTPFYAFTKAKGQSKKSSEIATGSFGIGKFAPYAVSKLRTVFVSTVYKDDAGTYRQLTQGKSILMSFDDAKGKRHQGVGFWGVVDKCQPVEDAIENLPHWIGRAKSKSEYKSSQGTKLVTLGFDDKKGWEKQLAASVAENFFGAISAGKLEVDVAGQYMITADTVAAVLKDGEVLESVTGQTNEPEQMENSSHYLACLEEVGEVIVEQSQMLHLGLCELRLRLEEGLPKKVCVLRNGMFISDSLSLAGLKSFGDFKDFVAVVQPWSLRGTTLSSLIASPRKKIKKGGGSPSENWQSGSEKCLSATRRIRCRT